MDSSSRRTNRHGIPLRGGGQPPCIWPGCIFVVSGLLPGTKLCWNHAQLVRTAVVKYEAEVDGIIAERAERMGLAMPMKADEVKGSGTIYYIQVGSHIKIGWTGDLNKRSRAYPPNAQLLATQPGTRTEERALHRRFAHHRTHGREWYPLAKELLDHVRRVVAEYGPPPAVTFSAREVEIPQPRAKQYIKPRHWVGHRSGN